MRLQILLLVLLALVSAACASSTVPADEPKDYYDVEIPAGFHPGARAISCGQVVARVSGILIAENAVAVFSDLDDARFYGVESSLGANGELYELDHAVAEDGTFTFTISFQFSELAAVPESGLPKEKTILGESIVVEAPGCKPLSFSLYEPPANPLVLRLKCDERGVS